MNDLALPLLHVFLSEHSGGAPVEALDASRVAPEAWAAVEADTYWCVTKILDGIQDHYTDAQPGLQVCPKRGKPAPSSPPPFPSRERGPSR